MRYPILSLPECEALAEKKLEGLSPSVEGVGSWTGQGKSIELYAVEELAESISDEVREISPDVDPDQVEGRFAGEVYLVLRELPIEALDDPGFWRYLSVVYFWDFIAWREKEPFENGNHMKYINGRAKTEAVLNRMYLRAKAVGSGHTELAGVLERSADFWRSHVIRVSTGSAPALTRSFVRMQANDRLMTDPLREFAKAINRTWSNIQLHMYDDAEAERLLNELRARLDQ